MSSLYPKIFIGGCPRSGTTWVHSIFQQHPEVIAFPRESHCFDLILDPFLYYPDLSFRERVLMHPVFWLKMPACMLAGFKDKGIRKSILISSILYEKSGLGPLMGISIGELSDIIKKERCGGLSGPARAGVVIRQVFDSFYEKNRTGQKRVFVEKTPQNIKFTDHILDLFPEAKMVEVIRDGRDVVVSMEKYNKNWVKDTMKGRLTHWKYYIEKGKKYRSMNKYRDRIITVKYEDLIDDFEDTVAYLFDSCGLGMNAELVRKIKKGTEIASISDKGEGKLVRTGRKGVWRGGLSDEEKALARREIGDLLDEMGYSL